MHCLTMPTLLRALAQATHAGPPGGRTLHSSAVAATYKYVNLQEFKTDMKSVTDRAARTLLWTELFRGASWAGGDRAGAGWAQMHGGGGCPCPPNPCCPQAWA